MNVRFSRGKIRFRIDTAELDRLIDRSPIEESVFFAADDFLYFTIMSVAGGDRLFKISKQGNNISLEVSALALENLKSNLAHSDFLSDSIYFAEGKSVKGVLEIDLHDPMLKNKKVNRN